MQVPTSVAIIQVLMFYWNYVVGLFCCSYEGDYFCCNYAVRGFCNTYISENFCSKYVGDYFYWNHASGSLCCNHAGGFFLQCIMQITISIVIMEVAVSVATMYVTASSSKFIFLSLTDINFSWNWPEKWKALYQVCISPLQQIFSENEDTLWVEFIYKSVKSHSVLLFSW